MGYHYLVDEEQFKNDLQKMKEDTLQFYTYACFSAFYRFWPSVYSEGRRVLFGTLTIPATMKLMEDFNRTFSNIKSEIKFKRRITEYSNYKHSGALGEMIVGDRSKYVWKTSFSVMGLKFSDEYTNESRFFLSTPIFQFFRSLTPQNAYERFFRELIKLKEYTVVNVLEKFNAWPTKGIYGMWCSLPVPMEKFMLLDNPEFINSVTKKMMSETGPYVYGISWWCDVYGSRLFRNILSR